MYRNVAPASFRQVQTVGLPPHSATTSASGSKKVVAIIAGVLLIVLVVVAGLEVGNFLGGVPGRVSSPFPLTSYVNLTIHYSPATGDSWYTPGNFAVPAMSRVVFTITNYDPSTNYLLVPNDNCVAGTVGGEEFVQVNSSHPPSQVTCLATTGVSHTFTMYDTLYNLNVPVPPAPNDRTPITVTFSATFGSQGTYQWGCMCRCGPMTEPGMMYGNVTVT